MLPLDGQETRAEKTNVTVDILTEFYARYPGLPSRLRNDTAPGQQTGRLSARSRPPSVAISVGTAAMIAIPSADVAVRYRYMLKGEAGIAPSTQGSRMSDQRLSMMRSWAP